MAIKLTFARALLTDLPEKLRAHAARQKDAALRKRLMGAAERFDEWLTQDGQKIACSAPFDSWAWLAIQCTRCKAGSLGPVLAASLARAEVMLHERNEDRERLEALRVEAEALRQREMDQDSEGNSMNSSRDRSGNEP